MHWIPCSRPAPPAETWLAQLLFHVEVHHVHIATSLEVRSKRQRVLDDPFLDLKSDGVASVANGGNRAKGSGHVCHMTSDCLR